MKFSSRHITLFVAIGLLAGGLASLHAQSDIKGDVYVLDPSKAFKAQLVASSGMTADVVISMPTLSGTMLLTGTAGAQGGMDRSTYLFNVQYGAGTGNALGAVLTSTTPTTNASASGLDILATADGTGTATALKLRATGSTADNYALEIAAGGIKITSTLPTAVSSSQPLVLEGGVVKIGSVGTLTGSGTTNTIPVWTGTSALGNSMLSQDGAGTVFTVAGRETITATTNQLVLGSTNTTTLSATAPAASRTYTMPDAGADASFVMTEGSRTINGPTTIDVGSGNNLTLSSNIATDASPLFLLTVNASNQVRRTTPGGIVWLTSGNTGITNTNNIVGIAETNANPLRFQTNNFDRVLISSAGDLSMPNTNHPTTGGRASISSLYTSLTGEAFAFQSATTFNNVATPGAGTFFGSQNNTILLTNGVAIPHLVGTRNRLAIQNSSSTIPNASMFLSDFSGRASGVAFTSFAAFRSKIANAAHTGVGAYNLTGLLLEGPNNDGLMHTNVSYTGIRVDTIPSGNGTRRVFFYNGVAGDEVLISRTGVVALGTTAPAATSKLEVNGTAGTPNVRFTSLSGTAKASTPLGFDRVIVANTNGDLDNVALTTLVGAVIPNGTVTDQTLRWNGTAWVANSTVLASGAGVVSATSASLSATTNQLVLGTTTTTTLNAAAPAASAVYTIPDVGTAASFVMSAGAQTVAGVKTFSSAPNLSSLTASLPLKLDGSNNITAAAINLASATEVTGTLPVNRGGTNSATALSSDRVMVSSSGAIVEAAALTNGQLLIGSTGAAPVAAALTAGSGITVTNGAGSISIAATNPMPTGTTTDATLRYSGTAWVENTNVRSAGGGALTLAATTNQLILGAVAGPNVTITAPAPTASRTYTIPDAGGAASFVMTAGAQTIADVKTFSSAPNLSSLTASLPLKLDGSKNITAAAIDLTSATEVTGALPINRGGTNSATALNSNRIMVSSGGAIVEAAALTNGQLLIGSTGAAPVAAALTAGSGITVTNGAGSITIAATNPMPAGTTTDATLRYSGSAWVENTGVLATSGGAITAKSTTNQLILGTTTTTTINATAPASSAVYTIPDVGTTASFVMTAGAQTIAGVKTFSSAPNLSSLTASLPLKLDASKNIVSAAIDLTSATEVTGALPINRGGTNSSTALNSNRIMVSSGGSIVEAAALTNGQLLIGSTGAAPVAAALTAGTGITVTNGAGSISLAVTDPLPAGTTTNATMRFNGTNWVENIGVLSNGTSLTIPTTTNQLVLGTTRTVTISAVTPATASRTYTMPDAGADASFVMTASAQTIGGVKTFSSAPNLSSLTASLPLKLDASNNITAAAINLASATEVTGALPINRGGTNSATSLNNNRIMVSNGGAIVEAAAMTDGQLLIGSTSAAPVVATITAGTGISVTNGAGSITIAATTALPTGSVTNSTLTYNGSNWIENTGVRTTTGGVITSIATSNQLVLGASPLTTTISAPAPVAARTYTIPDVSADASFVMTAGDQSIAGAKTLSSALTITPTTNQLVLGTTNTVTINAAAPAASRVYTIPAMSNASSFIMTEGAGFSTYTTGDILYASAANTLSKLPIGTNGQFLTISSGIPAWTSSSSSGVSYDVASAQATSTTPANFLFNVGYGTATATTAGARIASVSTGTNTGATGLTLIATGTGTSTATALSLAATGSSTKYALTIADNSGFSGFGTTTPTHVVHAVNSATTDEVAAVLGNASSSSASQAIGVWGDASSSGSGTAGSIGVLATGSGNTTAAQTNVALQVVDGNFTMGRTTETGTGYTAVEGATAGTAYTAQGPSGVIDVNLGTVGGWANNGNIKDAAWKKTSITINNRYISTSSIVMFTIVDKVNVSGGPDPEECVFVLEGDNRASGSILLQISAMGREGGANVNGSGSAFADGDKIKIGYVIVNPSR